MSLVNPRQNVASIGPRGVIVMGLDPGSRHTGYGVLERRGSRFRLLAQGRISPKQTLPLANRLHQVEVAVLVLLDQWQPEVVGLEAVFHGVNVRSLIVLAQARGAILATLGSRGLSPLEFTPAQVKQSVTGSGRADKRQVARMVEVLLGPIPGPLAADAADALAVAICCAHQPPIQTLRGLSPSS